MNWQNISVAGCHLTRNTLCSNVAIASPGVADVVCAYDVHRQRYLSAIYTSLEARGDVYRMRLSASTHLRVDDSMKRS